MRKDIIKKVKRCFWMTVVFVGMFAFSFAQEATENAKEAWGFIYNLINPEFFIGFLVDLVVAVIVTWIFLYLSKRISKSISHRVSMSMIGEEEDVEKVSILIWDMIFYALGIFSVFMWFEILGFDVGIVLWGLTFGIWMAFKEILGNMIAGVLILSTKEYSIGDIIEVWKDEHFGRIEEISIRYIVLRTFDLRRIIIPNLDVITSPVTTFTSEELIRLETTVGVHYDTDLKKATKVMKWAINELDFIEEKDSTKVIVEKFDSSSIQLKAYFYFNPEGDLNRPEVVSEANRAVKKGFDMYDIHIPYPITTLTLEKEEKNILDNAKSVIKSSKGNK